MLKIENLKKKYKSFEVLRGLNMNLETGDVYGFLGKNGCGKTTTMNIICNIIPKDEGKITFEDEKGNKCPAPKIGYLPETPALHTFMTGYEYLNYIASCASFEGDANKRVSEVLEAVNMTAGAKRRIKGYSRGMTQRLGIAAAIFDNPKLLILDEPTSALDPEGRAEVMGIIQDLKERGTTIILCTHIIADVERIANKIGIMKNGVIDEEGPIDEIMFKHRKVSNKITVRLTEPNAEYYALMRELSEVNASEYNEKNGTVILSSENADKLGEDLIALFYEKKIKIAEFTTQKMALEDVYLAVTGLKGATSNIPVSGSKV